MNAVLVFLLRLIFILLSYLFIGWIVHTIYKDLKGLNFNQAMDSIPPITLLTTIDQQQIKTSFAVPEVIIGRDPGCNFHLNDETISLRHSKLSYHHKQWWAEDLGSTNGSFLNGTEVNEPIVLTDGDQLKLGRKIIAIKTKTTLNGENNE